MCRSRRGQPDRRDVIVESGPSESGRVRGARPERADVHEVVKGVRRDQRGAEARREHGDGAWPR